MARIATSNTDNVYKIKKWLGVNENPDGDTNLKMGEASTMTNFKITNDFSLQKRPGTQNVSGLLSDYIIEVSETTTTVFSGINVPTESITVYPTISVSAGGILTLSGTTATVTSSNIATHVGKYWQNPAGLIYKLGTFTLTTPTSGTLVTGGSITLDSVELGMFVGSDTVTTYPNVSVTNSTVVLNGTPQSIPRAEAVGTYVYYSDMYHTKDGVYQITGSSPYGPSFMYYGKKVLFVANNAYSWDFYPVTAAPNTSGLEVRGIWSGRVGDTEYIVAACNAKLWALSESEGVWTKSELGVVSTTHKVHMFGFDEKLYIMNGSEYKVWDGETLSNVAGYRPIVITAANPTNGSGTALEHINMLNGLRRVRFSSTGGTTFQLPESGLASIDYVKYVSGATIATASLNTTTGLVTTSASTAAGTSNVEIGYTVSTTLRSQIEAMTLSELFNGANDNRVFIYGDGSNKAFYSGLDYNGQATAEYFPDMNVVHVGDGNTPITSMVRHFNRLVAFKEDSAYTLRYDTLELSTGVVTAGFYLTTVNKGLGCVGYGQAQVVVNHPRTLDGRSIYEWIATDSSGNLTSDQRTAQRISQKVEKTIREMNFPNAICFYDKINHEYFVVENGVAVVQNTENGTWYIYRNFPAICMIVYKDELYFGTSDGYVRHVSRDYRHDIGQPITCYWESGSMPFGKDFMRKYTDKVWVSLEPEQYSEVYLTLQSDKQTDLTEESVLSSLSGVASGIFDFADLNFEHFTFNLNDKPQMQTLKIKVKNYAYLKLILMTATDDTTCTVLGVDIKVRETGMVK